MEKVVVNTFENHSCLQSPCTMTPPLSFPEVRKISFAGVFILSYVRDSSKGGKLAFRRVFLSDWALFFYFCLIHLAYVSWEYKRASIDRRPSFYSNHVSAIVGKLYSEKAYYFESADRSTARGRIEGTKWTTFAIYAARKRETAQKSDLWLLSNSA